MEDEVAGTVIVEDESKLVATANIQLALLDKLIKNALRVPKRMIRMTIAGLLILAIVLGGLGYIYVNQSQTVRNSCMQTNQQKLIDQQNWDFFIDLLLKNDHKAADIQEGNVVKDRVAKADAPHTCPQPFGL